MHPKATRLVAYGKRHPPRRLRHYSPGRAFAGWSARWRLEASTRRHPGRHLNALLATHRGVR